MCRNVFGTGDFARQAYVVMERIPGQTLYKRLAELPLPYEEARLIVGRIADALCRPAPAERHPS